MSAWKDTKVAKFGNRPREVLVEDMGNPQKAENVCTHQDLGCRNHSHPHIIGITFPTERESLLDVGFGFLCGSWFSHKFPPDANIGSVLNTAQHCQLCILCSHREQLVLRILKPRFL